MRKLIYRLLHLVCAPLRWVGVSLDWQNLNDSGPKGATEGSMLRYGRAWLRLG